MREITRAVLRFLAGFMVVLMVSAFLAPLLFQFLPFKFDRILRRLIMIGTLILVAGLIRARGVKFSELGLGWNQGSFRLLAAGLAGGVFLVVLITTIQWGLGVRLIKIHQTDVWHWIGLVFKGWGAGLLIAVIEEFFFRAFLFLTLRELWKWRISLVVTNLIYALVHFFPKGHPSISAQPTFADSFRLYHAVIAPSPEAMLGLLPSILGLFLFGLILSFLFLGTSSLYPSIGVHAGAIFGMKLNRRFAPEIWERMDVWSGTKNLYDGVAGLVTLGCMAVVVGWWMKTSGKR